MLNLKEASHLVNRAIVEGSYVPKDKEITKINKKFKKDAMLSVAAQDFHKVNNIAFISMVRTYTKSLDGGNMLAFYTKKHDYWGYARINDAEVLRLARIAQLNHNRTLELKKDLISLEFSELLIKYGQVALNFIK